jgi:hypothetical protein
MGVSLALTHDPDLLPQCWHYRCKLLHVALLAPFLLNKPTPSVLREDPSTCSQTQATRLADCSRTGTEIKPMKSCWVEVWRQDPSLSVAEARKPLLRW